jgi:hypothetical protein
MRGDGVFEVLHQRRDHNFSDAITIGWRSARFQAHQSMHLRQGWARNSDPRELVRFIEELVGITLHNFDRLRLRDGEAVVQALLPHFECEIHAFMERMEARDRHRHFEWSTLNNPDNWNIVAQWNINSFEIEDPEAKKKATTLLVKNLDEKQSASFTAKREFETVGKDGKTYRITANRSFNVIGPDGTKYCGQTADTPVEDQMLAQKLLLEHEPEKFFKNANVSRPAVTGTSAMEIMMGQREVMLSPTVMMLNHGWMET